MRIRSIIIATLTALALAGGGSLAMIATAAPSTVTTMLETHSMTKKANTPAQNKVIRDLGGIAPCRHEDGSGQPLPCYWNGKVRGNKTGLSYIMMPSKGDDPRQVIIARG